MGEDNKEIILDESYDFGEEEPQEETSEDIEGQEVLLDESYDFGDDTEDEPEEKGIIDKVTDYFSSDDEEVAEEEPDNTMSRAMNAEEDTTDSGSPMSQAMTADGYKTEDIDKDLNYSGNIDLDKRKVLKDGDEFKTEESITIGITIGDKNEEKQVIIPTVIDGKKVSDKEATDHFFKTKQHLGMYETKEYAEAQAEKIHLRQGKKYNQDGTKYMKPDRPLMDKLFGRGEDWENPEREDWEVGKLMVNASNKMASGTVKGLYRLMGNVAYGYTGAVELAFTGKTDKAEDTKDWFEKAGQEISNYIYEENKLDVKRTHTPKTIKEAYYASGIFDIDTVQEILSYGLDSTAESAIDMGAMITMFPPYALGRIENGAGDRAENDGRKKATLADFFNVIPTEMTSMYLDRMGVKATTTHAFMNIRKAIAEGGAKEGLKQIGKETGKGFIIESATEGTQTIIEKFGHEWGTKMGISSVEAYGQEAFWASVAGGIGGAGMSTVSSTIGYATKPTLETLIAQQIDNVNFQPVQDRTAVLDAQTDGKYFGRVLTTSKDVLRATIMRKRVLGMENLPNVTPEQEELAQEINTLMFGLNQNDQRNTVKLQDLSQMLFSSLSEEQMTQLGEEEKQVATIQDKVCSCTQRTPRTRTRCEYNHRHRNAKANCRCL